LNAVLDHDVHDRSVFDRDVFDVHVRHALVRRRPRRPLFSARDARTS